MEELQTLERQVIAFLENPNITIERSDITARHSLPHKDSRAKPAVIVHFVNHKNKTDNFNKWRSLKQASTCMNILLDKQGILRIQLKVCGEETAAVEDEKS